MANPQCCAWSFTLDQICGHFGNTDQPVPCLVSIWVCLCSFYLWRYHRRSLHLCDLHIVRVIDSGWAKLCAVPPLPGRACVAAAYLKKRRGASWSDRRLRGLPRRRPLRSGSSHAMLMARWEVAFWEVEFGGDGRARDWGALFTAVKTGGGFPALLWEQKEGINSQKKKSEKTHGTVSIVCSDKAIENKVRGNNSRSLGNDSRSLKSLWKLKL